MPKEILLASASDIRQQLLRNAGVVFRAVPANIDEAGLRDAMLAENASPRDIADTLAEMKARKVAGKHPEGLVLGCDQVLAHRGELLSKPASPKRPTLSLSGCATIPTSYSPRPFFTRMPSRSGGMWALCG